MTHSSWQNLALAAALTFYLILIGLFLINFGQIKWCDNFAIDYCAFWSGGRIINERSIAEVYDLGTLLQFQKEIFPQATSPTFEPFAIMYLPVFIIPFKLISIIQLPYSYLAWTMLNFFGFILYLRFFVRKTTGKSLPLKILLMMLVSFPVFQNLYLGQVSFWLGISAGELMRAYLDDKPLKAGLWLGGWLLKPQLLVLILPFLLLRRSMKVIFGFAISSVIAMVTSFALIGVDGFLDLANTLFVAAGGGMASNTEVMMNWRMLGWHIESLTSPTIGWAVILVGTLLTVGVTGYVFRNRSSQEPTRLAVFLLGLFAATGAVTWHAHVHMSIILIPPMILLLMKKRFNQYLFSVWVFVPIFVQIIIIAIIPFIELESSAFSIIEGLRGFILNLLILGWAVFHYNKAEEETHSESMILNGKELV